jgi:hypothetical protein
MIDTGQQLRASYVAALNGNLSYEGSPVPIVDEKLDVQISEHDIYVMCMDQVEDAEAVKVKSHFSNETLLTLMVINQRRSTNTKEVVENVSNQILNILFPTVTTVGFTLSSPLKLVYAHYVNGEYNPVVQNEQGFIISKKLLFKNRLTQ